MKYSMKRMASQIQMKNCKYITLREGLKLAITAVVEGTIHRNGMEQSADYMICQDPNGMKFKLMMRDYLKMKVNNGSSYMSESGSDMIQLPKSIEIVGHENRRDRDHNVMYPIFAYNKVDEMLASEDGSFTYENMLMGGLREDHNFEPTKNYTIKVEF